MPRLFECVLCLVLGALASAACGQSVWTVERIAFDWNERTLAIPADDGAWLLHGRDVARLDRAGKLHRHEGVLPIAVSDRTAVARAADGTFWLCGGATGRTFKIDPRTWQAEEVPPLARKTTRGLRIVVHDGSLYAMTGHDGSLLRLESDRWRVLPAGHLFPLGRRSAGLYSLPGGLAAYGDHHVSWWNAKTGRWRPNRPVWTVLRMRPAVLRGGMSTQDPETGLLLLTLGKSSRSIGVADLRGRRYFHLRPRLPGKLRHPGETLYVSGRGPRRRLVVLSLEDRQRWSLPMASLQRIDAEDRRADVDSRWEVWNAMPWGGHGSLIREGDGLASSVVVGRWMYTQRKNQVRRWNLDTKQHSENRAGHAYGDKWIGPGAALATDGKSRLFMVTGHDRTTWVLHVLRRRDGKDPAVAGAPDVAEMLVTRGPDLPRPTRGNTALCWHGGRLWAVLGPESRELFAWRPGAGDWESVSAAPAGVVFDAAHDIELLSDGDGLVLLSGDRWARRAASGRWKVCDDRLSFAASADGGMAAIDPDTRRVYVVLGGGSRDMGLIDLATGKAHRLADHLPDAASVYGRRIWITETAGKRHLYLYRGHDTDELWRISLE